MQPKFRPLHMLVAALAFVAPQLNAQQITGRIVDQGSGQPMAAVQVSITGTGIGALSQQTGRYLLLNVPVGTHTVTAQRIGYRTVTAQVTVAAGATVVQDFSLSEEALGLDEIVVTGTAGGTQRRALGNAVASVAAADVAKKATVNGVQDLLTGRVPGAQFRGISGNVGTGGSIQIRGVKSFTLSSNPLIFIDGVRMDNSTNLGPSLGDRRQSSTLDNINPQDIQSIEIIKGPAAATLYGTEASAGVVQIITKRGAQSTPQFSATVRGGVNYLKDPAGRLGGFWYCSDLRLSNGSCLPEGWQAPAGFVTPPNCVNGIPKSGCATYTLKQYNPYDEANRLLEEGMWGPWPKPRLYNYGPTQSYNLQVTGGTANVKYFVSAGFDKDQGADYYNTNKVTRLRSNTNLVFSDKITSDVSLGFTKGFTRFGNSIPTDGGSWDDMNWGDGGCIPGLATDPAGTAKLDQYGRPNPCPRTMGFQQMLPTDVTQIDVTRDFSNFTGSLTLNFLPTTWLTTRAVVGLDKGWETDETFFPLYIKQSGVGPGTCGIPQDLQNACVSTNLPRQNEGELNYSRPTTQYISMDVGATAKFNFMDDRLGTATSVGVQYYDRYFDRFENVARGFASPLSTTVNQGTLSKMTVTYEQTQNKSGGMFVQEELNWQRRLFITGALRFDGNSAFGSALNLEMYPKVSGTWTVSDEPFWNVEWINSLRIRTAFGASGRQPDTFAKVTRYAVTQGPVGSSALTGAGAGNSDVRPERSQEIETGFDISLFDGRISSEFTYFYNKTTDALLNVPTPPSFGVAGSISQNIGRIDAWGWEESLHTRIYQSPLISVSLDMTATNTDNMIKDIGAYPASGGIQVGWPYPNVTTRYYLTSAAYDPTGKKVDPWGNKIKAMCDSGVKSTDGVGSEAAHGLVQGGDPIDCELKDSNSLLRGRAFFNYQFSVAPTIDLFDNTLSLHVSADGQFGRIGSEERGAGLRYGNGWNYRCHCDALAEAMLQYGDGRYGGAPDYGFIKFREAGARYSIPSSIAERIGATRASLAVSGRELGLWRKEGYIWNSAMTGDPETTDTNRIIPPPTRWTVELNVAF
jgi:TonB-linked SusC/RagA family outer membrane protein